MIVGLSLDKEMRIKQIKILSDSQLVVNQMKGIHQVRDLKMTTYLKNAMELKECFSEIDIKQISRDKNSHANALANLDQLYR